MTNDLSILDCRFFFLFELNTHQQEKDALPLPNLPRNSLLEHGILVDEDKLLIGSGNKIQAHEKSADFLVESWKKIVGLHEPAYTAALLGVAMVIADDSLEYHTIPMTLIDDAGKSSPITFKRSPHKRERELFTVQTEGMSEPTRFEQFVACTDNESGDYRYRYSLVFRENQVFLQPISGTNLLAQEATKTPIFSVYGIEHPELEESHKAGKTWPKDLQQLLMGKKDSKESAITTPIVSRLILRQWQFTRIDCVASQLRSQLPDNVRYRQLSQQDLVCKSDGELEKDLEGIIDKQTVQVKHLQARLHKAIRTLEINRNNLNKKLEKIQQDLKKQNWQFTLEFTGKQVLAEIFQRDIRTLENHQHYLTAELLDLEALHQRWHLQLEGRRLAHGNRMETLAHILILLVALGEMGNITKPHSNTVASNAHEVVKSCEGLLVGWLDKLNNLCFIQDVTALLHSLFVYLAVILVFIVGWLLFPGRKWVKKKWNCWRNKRRNRQSIQSNDG
ncbi:MAG: hypothetical protein BWK78_01400 [Thiotrichaceae bacterium IS1]|nr:MAG: hypothetical protein BWK78_01400 [Thiotrichaceae bacterium IS1]